MNVQEYPKTTRVFFETAVGELEKLDAADICRRTGAVYDAAGSRFLVPFLGADAVISAADYSMQWRWPVNSMFHITILHYLIRADGCKPKGEWISLYDAAPPGSTRIHQMLKANIPPLIEVFGGDLELFYTCAEKLGGSRSSPGTVDLLILPHIPARVTIWPRDDEFPADARILFDKTLLRQLYAEDIVYTADVVVRALIGVSGREYAFPLQL